MAQSVLIVEDDPILVEVLEQLLDDEGFDVRHVADGHQALSEVASNQPDLIVTDLMMPRLDGLSLTMALRESGNTIPVVMMSAVFDDVDLPGVRFVAKPFDIDDFVQVVHTAVNGDSKDHLSA